MASIRKNTIPTSIRAKSLVFYHFVKDLVGIFEKKLKKWNNINKEMTKIILNLSKQMEIMPLRWPSMDLIEIYEFYNRY